MTDKQTQFSRDKKILNIRGLDVWPPLFLAPMAGLTHTALRTTILSFGGVGLLSTEMLAAQCLPKENANVSPYLIRTEQEFPLSYQLLLSQLDVLKPAVAALESLAANAIDINLGCPAPRVRKAGGGSQLAANVQLVRTIIREARKETSLPLTAKIRLGRHLDADALRDFCLMLEGEGVDMLTIHARLESESFCRKPRWGAIADIKKNLSIPVIANGGIDCVDAAKRCLRESGADGLMIGRCAAAKPWIFSEIARGVYGLESESLQMLSLPRVYHDFCQALQERFRIERRLGRLKEFTHYFATNYAFGHHLASRVQSSVTVKEALGRASEFFGRTDAEAFTSLQDELGESSLFKPLD